MLQIWWRNFVVTASAILRPDTVYRVHLVVLPGSPDLVFKALITKGSGQHVASASSSDSVDAGTSNHLLLKVHFLSLKQQRILWQLIVLDSTTQNSCKCTDPGFHFRGRLPTQTGGLRRPASAASRSHQGESSSLPFRLSIHYRPVEPEDICQCNDRYNKIEKPAELNYEFWGVKHQFDFITVRFRIILTQMDLKPYTDPITIFILVSC